MVKAFIRRPVFEEARIRFHVCSYGIFSGQSATPPSTSVFPCQYHSTIAPYSFIYHPHSILFFSQYFSFPLSVSFHYCSILIHSYTTYAVYCFLPVLQFSPVSIIPPLLHTHSSIYNPHCIMFFSQYFSFPLSVPFHHRSIATHPTTTHDGNFGKWLSH